MLKILYNVFQNCLGRIDLNLTFAIVKKVVKCLILDIPLFGP